MPNDGSNHQMLVVRVVIEAVIVPAHLKPYPVIANWSPSEQAKQIVENAVTENLRWIDGVDELRSVKTSVVSADWTLGTERRVSEPRRQADRPADSLLVAGARMEVIADPHLNPQRCPSCNSPDVLRRFYSGDGCSDAWHDQPVTRRGVVVTKRQDDIIDPRD